jgi:hypothetical protein
VANVYSVLIGAGTMSGSPGRFFLGTPPGGFVWVVRDVLFMPPAPTYVVPLPGVWLEDTNHNVLCATPPGCSDPYVAYHFDLHQVIAPPLSLYYMNDGAGYKYRVSGYQLALP